MDAKSVWSKRNLGDAPCSSGRPANAGNAEPSNERSDTAANKKRENAGELEFSETTDRSAADNEQAHGEKNDANEQKAQCGRRME